MNQSACPDANAVPVSEITRLYAAKRYGDADVASCGAPCKSGIAGNGRLLPRAAREGGM